LSNSIDIQSPKWQLGPHNCRLVIVCPGTSWAVGIHPPLYIWVLWNSYWPRKFEFEYFGACCGTYSQFWRFMLLLAGVNLPTAFSSLPNWYLHIQGGFNILKKGIILPVASSKRW
jgi:hypothetical protein